NLPAVSCPVPRTFLAIFPRFGAASSLPGIRRERAIRRGKVFPAPYVPALGCIRQVKNADIAPEIGRKPKTMRGSPGRAIPCRDSFREPSELRAQGGGHNSLDGVHA